MTDLYVGNFGQQISMSVTLDGEAMDMEGAVVQFIFVRPDGTRSIKTPQTSLGEATYVIEKGLVTEAGRWKGILTVDMGDAFHSFPFEFEIKPLP